MNNEELKRILGDIEDITTWVSGQPYPYYPDQVYFLNSEIKTLKCILDLKEKKNFKECLILLRTVLEKFLLFWLMLFGKKFKHREELTLLPNKKEGINEIGQKERDAWIKKQKEAKSKDPQRFEAIREISPSGKNKVVVLYEYPGIKDEKGEYHPIHPFLFREYDPNIAFLSNTDTINLTSKKITKEKKQLHHQYYHFHFSFDGILKTLEMNKLINNEQKNMILIHYNFFSKYVHNSKSNIDMEYDREYNFNFPFLYSKIYDELISLYLAKFLYLYIKIILEKFYNNDQRQFIHKYREISKLLRNFSKKLWFIDDWPTKYDIQSSQIKQSVSKNRLKPNKIIYYEDPFIRLRSIP